MGVGFGIGLVCAAVTKTEINKLLYF
jgi:hypothetical protein